MGIARRLAHRWAPLLCLALAAAQEPSPPAPRPAVIPGGVANRAEPEAIGLAAMVREPRSELAGAVERWSLDAERLRRLHPVDSSPALRARLRSFHRAWLAELRALDWASLSREGAVDALALRTWIERRLGELERAERTDLRLAPFLDFEPAITDLCEARARIEPVDARVAADALDAIAARIGELETVWGTRGDESQDAALRFDASRAAKRVSELRSALREWHSFYDGYDPEFTWWCRAPHEAASAALERYARLLRERIVKVGTGEADIVGDPIGAEALAQALADEWIPYGAAELVALAEREADWCEARMREAARAMGCGDDWKAALEQLKQRSVEPGAQPILIRDMTLEAIDFLRTRDLIGVPALAAETWRMEMLSPESQRQNPFFLGGESIQVSYPTDAMSHAEKRMSLRGNNPHFARAVVHHEVIPGHNLQGFFGQRSNPHRRVFSTPFWTEGWALYWELLLWDEGFAATPEDRLGMLFWRMHRCARIVFSLKFHLGEMSAPECIDFLVERVGHERANAAAEVRRSFAGDYGPLYQAGYLLGGLQFRALSAEQVKAGTWKPRAFHDQVIRAGSLPVELVRALFTQENLTFDTRTRWRFAD